MKNLKTFVDITGKRVTKGEPVSTAYDKDTLAHYKRHGLIGDPAGTKPAATKRRAGLADGINSRAGQRRPG
jgi:hypothetical protein